MNNTNKHRMQVKSLFLATMLTSQMAVWLTPNVYSQDSVGSGAIATSTDSSNCESYRISKPAKNEVSSLHSFVVTYSKLSTSTPTTSDNELCGMVQQSVSTSNKLSSSLVSSIDFNFMLSGGEIALSDQKLSSQVTIFELRHLEHYRLLGSITSDGTNTILSVHHQALDGSLLGIKRQLASVAISPDRWNHLAILSKKAEVTDNQNLHSIAISLDNNVIGESLIESTTSHNEVRFYAGLHIPTQDTLTSAQVHFDAIRILPLGVALANAPADPEQNELLSSTRSSTRAAIASTKASTATADEVPPPKVYYSRSKNGKSRHVTLIDSKTLFGTAINLTADNAQFCLVRKGTPASEKNGESYCKTDTNWVKGKDQKDWVFADGVWRLEVANVSATYPIGTYVGFWKNTDTGKIGHASYTIRTKEVGASPRVYFSKVADKQSSAVRLSSEQTLHGKVTNLSATNALACIEKTGIKAGYPNGKKYCSDVANYVSMSSGTGANSWSYADGNWKLKVSPVSNVWRVGSYISYWRNSQTGQGAKGKFTIIEPTALPPVAYFYKTVGANTKSVTLRASEVLYGKAGNLTATNAQFCLENLGLPVGQTNGSGYCKNTANYTTMTSSSTAGQWSYSDGFWRLSVSPVSSIYAKGSYRGYWRNKDTGKIAIASFVVIANPNPASSVVTTTVAGSDPTYTGPVFGPGTPSGSSSVTTTVPRTTSVTTTVPVSTPSPVVYASDACNKNETNATISGSLALCVRAHNLTEHNAQSCWETVGPHEWDIYQLPRCNNTANFVNMTNGVVYGQPFFYDGVWYVSISQGWQKFVGGTYRYYWRNKDTGAIGYATFTLK